MTCSTNKSITFALSIKNNCNLWQIQKKVALTEIEADLIETGRNYKRSYPNGDPNLRYYLERLFVEWLEGENY